eukprot:c7723_g1_i1.p1 GENE.c7723_g1_i1~~c7723_g1_i1.p1  ORF type:complete len:282 (-),score=67.38 c7723_g1_i1:16-861(-)
MSLKTSKLLFLEEGQEAVWRWDALTEAFEDISTTEDGLRIAFARHNEVMFNGDMAPYPQIDMNDWLICTDRITKEAVARLQRHDVIDLDDDKKYRFMAFETRQNSHFDQSPLLQQLFEKYSQSDVLGELQISFSLFILGDSYAAMNQWRNVLTLICSSDTILSDDQTFCAEFLEVFRVQLQRLPEDFFVTVAASENFLPRVIKNLFQILDHTSPLSREIIELRTQIQNTMQTKHGVVLHATAIQELQSIGLIDEDGNVIDLSHFVVDDDELPVVVGTDSLT